MMLRIRFPVVMANSLSPGGGDTWLPGRQAAGRQIAFELKDGRLKNRIHCEGIILHITIEDKKDRDKTLFPRSLALCEGALELPGDWSVLFYLFCRFALCDR
jgi:hypothetical protein